HLVGASEHLVIEAGGEEDDGDVLGALALLDQSGHFEAVHPRQADVEKNEAELVAQDRAQGLRSGGGLDELISGLIVEDRAQREEILPPVIDEQDLDRPGCFRHGRPLCTASSCSAANEPALVRQRTGRSDLKLCCNVRQRARSLAASGGRETGMRRAFTPPRRTNVSSASGGARSPRARCFTTRLRS